MKTILTACAMACVLPTMAAGQAAFAPAPAPAAAIAPASGDLVLRTGTPVSLTLLDELTTKGKKLRVGQRFRMETAQPVLVQGMVVIPAGSPVVGEVTEVRNKGMWGKSGHLSARVVHVTAGGRQIRLSGVFDDKGKAGGVGAAAVSAVVFLPAGFFMTGTSARVAPGTPVQATIDEDVPVVLAAPAVAPPAMPAATN